MPARHSHHDVVKATLIADGWTITHDPLMLHVGKKDHFVDLGAERLLAADKEGRKITVEIRSFPGASEVEELQEALGRSILYQGVLGENEPDRRVYLAIPHKVFEDLFTEPIGQLLLRRERLRLIVFDPQKGGIVHWIPE
jgi:XisH protein